ncbi:MAG TPA: hypothetical protein VMN36_18410 [Verrucomicrobiales bacterium]|nr:hypothetical protein [Verrucomicrobiales bacterium]
MNLWRRRIAGPNRPAPHAGLSLLAALALYPAGAESPPDPPPLVPPVPAEQHRKPVSQADLSFWLNNMVAHHRFSLEEVRAATGLDPGVVREALERLAISPGGFTPPKDRLRILPYPGGRHPRSGFLEGAVDPQRESKMSVFIPWDPSAYVVVDLPEAIWSNLGLSYLAHTHVPTIWSEAGVALDRLEWDRSQEGRLTLHRRLPNGIAFEAAAVSLEDHVRMRLKLTNGTGSGLTGLRVQMCVMLRGAAEFAEAGDEHRVLRPPFAACRSTRGDRWIITGWEPIQRAWANPPVPCIHADPQFPDCAAGSTVAVNGWLSFYSGSDLDAELERITALDWASNFPGAD